MFLKLLNLVGETPQTDPFCRGREKVSALPLDFIPFHPPFRHRKNNPTSPMPLPFKSPVAYGTWSHLRERSLYWRAHFLGWHSGCNLDRPEPQSLAWYSRAPIFSGQKKIPVSCRFRGDILASLRELSPSPIKREIRGPQKKLSLKFEKKSERYKQRQRTTVSS